MKEKKEKYFAHESAFIDEPCQIGEDTKIWHFSHIMKNAKIGQNCIISQNVFIGSDVIIGNACKIQNGVSVYKGVIIEDNVFVGPNATFTNVLNPRSFIERKKEFKTTIVQEGATIGAGAIIICGNNIGSFSFIGAGSVVTKDVPDFALFYGNPAEQKGWVCVCGEKLSPTSPHVLTCSKCNKKYKIEKDRVSSYGI